MIVALLNVQFFNWTSQSTSKKKNLKTLFTKLEHKRIESK